MFLSTIREIIQSKPECLGDYIDTLSPLFLEQAGNQDESIRNIVAESVGKFYRAHPGAFTNVLIDEFGKDNDVVKATLAKSFKFAAHRAREVPLNLAEFIEILTNFISHDSVDVKRNSLDSLSQIARNNELKHLLADKYEGLIDLAIQQTPHKKEYEVTIDLGAFKHVVDHGVPLRKAAYALLENICDKFQFNQAAVVDAAIAGVKDPSEEVLA